MSDTPTPKADSIALARKNDLGMNQRDEATAIELAARAYQMSGAEAAVWTTLRSDEPEHIVSPWNAQDRQHTREIAAHGDVADFLKDRGYTNSGLSHTAAWNGDPKAFNDTVSAIMSLGQQVARGRARDQSSR